MQRASVDTGWPSVRTREGGGEIESLICNAYLSAATRTAVCADPSEIYQHVGTYSSQTTVPSDAWYTWGSYSPCSHLRSTTILITGRGSLPQHNDTYHGAGFLATAQRYLSRGGVPCLRLNSSNWAEWGYPCWRWKCYSDAIGLLGRYPTYPYCTAAC